jgi:hypothetical protein
MAFEQPGFKPTGLIAAGDLSASQFKAVKISAALTVAAVAAVTDIPIGVLQNNPSAAGQAAEVMTTGISRMVAGAAITVPNSLTVDATGRAVAAVLGTDTTKHVIGQAIEPAAAAGDIIAVLLNVTPNRAS